MGKALRKDLTILYYTANYLPEHTLKFVQSELLKFGYPIVSVSQKPIDFGENICVGDIGRSIYNIYVQILTGAKKVKTKYVACAEDDILYNREHFEFAVTDDAFYYNMSRYGLGYSKKHGGYIYYYRPWVGMCCCIAPTDLLIEVLEERFEKYPDHIPMGVPQPAEPGKRDKKFGLKKQTLKKFYSYGPIVILNHRTQVGGKRKIIDSDRIYHSIYPWGSAADLWGKFFKE